MRPKDAEPQLGPEGLDYSGILKIKRGLGPGFAAQGVLSARGSEGEGSVTSSPATGQKPKDESKPHSP